MDRILDYTMDSYVVDKDEQFIVVNGKRQTQGKKQLDTFYLLDRCPKEG